MKKVTEFKRAASGAGVVVFQMLALRTMRILLSVRTKDVGPGFGITGGGYVKINDIDLLPVGTVVQNADQAHLESLEENGGFENVISADEFLERAQPIMVAHVRTPDVNRVHGVTQYALRVRNDAEWDAFAVLPPGVDDDGNIEREGPLVECIMTWTSDISRRTPEQSVAFAYPDGSPLDVASFFHKHEVHGIATIAWHAENGKLWL
ncbi:MAG: hypothetical protein RLZZ480_379 [Candidatus Parcubacteria bacterium]|jgi:hypothetical protein